MSTLNQYDGTWAQNDKESVVAADMETAARVLAASKGSDPLLLQRVKEGIQVEMPVLDVAFNAKVSDTAAEAAGCQVFPGHYIVPAGTKQIFSVLLVAGWQVDGWEIDGAAVTGATGNVVELTVPSSPTTVEIRALVSAV
jgi:hypothetical protein